MLTSYSKEEKGEKNNTKKQITLDYHFGGGRFHMLSHSYEFSQGLCLNHHLQVWLIGDQRYQVPLFIYINPDDDMSCLVIVSKVLGATKYLMRSVKRSAKAVGFWTEENWDEQRVSVLYTMVSDGSIF